MENTDQYILLKDSIWLLLLSQYSFGRNLMIAEETQSVSYHVNVSMFPRKLLSIQSPSM